MMLTVNEKTLSHLDLTSFSFLTLPLFLVLAMQQRFLTLPLFLVLAMERFTPYIFYATSDGEIAVFPNCFALLSFYHLSSVFIPKICNIEYYLHPDTIRDNT
jgi:hypothetical protein